MRRLQTIHAIFGVLMLLGWASTASAQTEIANFRPYDKDGATMFETPKETDAIFEGLKVRIGGNFAQQFQSLDHENTPLDLNADGVIDNPLYALAPGFNLATANLNIDVQLYEGIRLNLVTYLSSRHHQETWVKGGFIQFDELTFLNSPLADRIMENVTLRVGHMETNYGDYHFRRTDNGNAMYNPFVGNYILDNFTTEIGGEVTFQKNGVIAMGAITGGEISGNVAEPVLSEFDDKAKRSPAYVGKLGFDKQLSEKLRVRLTGSVYTTSSSARNTLYAGDRTGSRYYLVTEAPGASTSAAFTSGRYNPGLTDKVTAYMGNVFVKYAGLEFFGTYETANGRTNAEREMRNVNQLAGELLYRFGGQEQFYLGGRYNVVNAEDPSGADITIDRTQIGAGWFVTKNVLAKFEYVNQNYDGFNQSTIVQGAEVGNRLYGLGFNGIMVEAVVGF